MEKGVHATTMHANVTKMHMELHDFIGDWNLKQRSWSEPGGKPAEHAGHSKCISVADGIATLMTTEVKDTNFKGIALMTYNKRQRHYELAWVDTEGDIGVLMMNGLASRAASSKDVQAKFGASSTQARVWGTSLVSASACVDEDVLAAVAQFANADMPTRALADAGETGVSMRLVENKISNDHWVLDFYVPGPDGGQFLVQQNEFTRA